MKYDCDYCDLWNIYTGKCTYEYCPLEEGAQDAFPGRGIKPGWITQWNERATPEDWRELRELQEEEARNEPTPEEWEELRREHFEEHPEELTQIPPHWRK